MLRMNDTARIYRASGEASSPTYTADSDTVPCEFQPLTPGAAFEQWGIELSEPARIFGRVDDWETVAVNDRVTVGGKTYAVRATPRLWRGLSIQSVVNHAVILLERVRGAE